MDFCTYFFALGIPTQAFFRGERSFKIEKYFAKNKKTVQNIFILIILLKMSAQGIHMLRKVYKKKVGAGIFCMHFCKGRESLCKFCLVQGLPAQKKISLFQKFPGPYFFLICSHQEIHQKNHPIRVSENIFS